jgi:hypothetical protein
MTSTDAPVGIADDDGFIPAPHCAWVIPVLLDSHASAAATLAFRSSSRAHDVVLAASSLSHQSSKV